MRILAGLAAAIAITVLAAGCEESELRIPILSPAEGPPVSQPQPARPGSRTLAPGQPRELREEIDEPEEESTTWDEPILAGSPEEAERVCRRLAAARGVSLDRVQQPSRVRVGQTRQYRCWFRSNSPE
jgi:hypothetical protein